MQENQTQQTLLEQTLKEFHDLEIEAKALDLKDEQDKIEREVFKYNNNLDEREKRYNNSLQQTYANLKIRLLELSGREFSKEELVEMGYYRDVVNCVTAYYDSFSATVAYNDYARDTTLPIYLDDMYENILVRFRSLSLDEIESQTSTPSA